MTTASATQPVSFIRDLQIRQEPRAQLGRFFLAADRALAAKRVVMSRVPFSEFRRVYSDNLASWQNGLIPCFDSEATDIPDDTSAAFLAYDESGSPIGATAMRVWDFGTSNLKAESESMRLYFGNPLSANAVGWQCEMPPIAVKMSGKMLYAGAYWVRPDWRGKGLGLTVPAIPRFYALARWDVDYKITFGSKAFLAPEIRKLYQYEDYQDGAHFMLNGETIYKGLLLWARRSFMIDDLPELTAQLECSLTAPVGDGQQKPFVTGMHRDEHA